jgi:uncharacterized membrane protein YeiB
MHTHVLLVITGIALSAIWLISYRRMPVEMIVRVEGYRAGGRRRPVASDERGEERR